MASLYMTQRDMTREEIHNTGTTHNAGLDDKTCNKTRRDDKPRYIKYDTKETT